VTYQTVSGILSPLSFLLISSDGNQSLGPLMIRSASVVILQNWAAASRASKNTCIGRVVRHRDRSECATDWIPNVASGPVSKRMIRSSESPKVPGATGIRPLAPRTLCTRRAFFSSRRISSRTSRRFPPSCRRTRLRIAPAYNVRSAPHCLHSIQPFWEIFNSALLPTTSIRDLGPL